MDEQVDLLDDLNRHEIELDEYKRGCKTLQKVTLVFSLVCFLVYTFLIDNAQARQEGLAYRLGSAIGIVLFVLIPSGLLGSIVAIFVHRKFPYIERFRKWWWIFAVGFSVLLTLGMVVMAISRISRF